jgi:hypothetical protein
MKGGRKYKKTRRTHKYKKTKQQTRNTRKTRKTRTNKHSMKNLGRGLTNCCMCGKPVEDDNSFMPSECSINNGRRAHRICKECWWKPITGFAIEGNSHKCPGCEKGLPLTHVKVKTPEMVDLTKDSD